jgi:RNA polymerase sigma-70 factor, ECF subfamily
MKDAGNETKGNTSADAGESAPAEGALNSYVTRASLFQRLRQDDTRGRDEAWRVFHARYAPIIAGFAAKCGASRQDIDDIIQDVMAAFVGVQGDFAYDPAKGRFRGWLKTCTVRAAIRRSGKNLRFRGIPLDELPDADVAVEPEWNDVWEKQLVSEALALLLVESSNGTAFIAFDRYVLRGESADDVATALGTSVNNVHQAKTRMTKRLREIVAELRRREDQ